HRRADAHAGEAELRDRRVDDAHLAELLKQAFRDLICALIHRDFLSHEEDAIVALHLFAQRLIEGVSVCDYWHSPLRASQKTASQKTASQKTASQKTASQKTASS